MIERLFGITYNRLREGDISTKFLSAVLAQPQAGATGTPNFDGWRANQTLASMKDPKPGLNVKAQAT